MKAGLTNTISRRFAGLLLIIAGTLAVPAAAKAQMPPPEQLKGMVEASKDRWVAFRNWNGRQWIYLTIPLTYHCGIKEMRYSLNGTDLAERWPVPDCNPQMPFNIDREKAQVYRAFDPGTVGSVSLQLVYTDGTESAVRTYKPCENAGETTCGALVE